MGITEISLVLTSLTAIAAVLGPIISSVINVRSNERTKRDELYSPRVYEALQKLTEAFGKFPRYHEYARASELGRIAIAKEYTAAYKAFTSATYEIMSLLPNQDIHELSIALLADLDDLTCIVSDQDKQFQKLAKAIALELSSQVSLKKKRIPRKPKRSKCE